jgi:hypothetical protein
LTLSIPIRNAARAPDRTARISAVALALAVPLGFVLLNLFMGQDANWDLRNYHWYNAHSYLNGRFFFDVVPAQTPSFYNPTLDIPFFLLGNAVPAPAAYGVLAFVQGLNFVPLFAVAYVILRIDRSVTRVWTAAAIALIGVLGGGNVSQIGTTFHDNTVSLGFLGALALIAIKWESLFNGPARTALGWAFAAGLMVGAAMGLKQPSVIYCIGVCFGFLAAPTPWPRRVALTLVCGIGIVTAVAALSGHWMWFLWETHGNPLHPYYNNIFKSPLGAISDYKDLHYHPKTAWERLALPFRFSADPLISGEILFRDYRILALYMALPVAAVAGALSRRDRPHPFATPGTTRWLLTVAALSYAAWAWMFCIYRYAVPIEMLAPLCVVLTLGLLPVSRAVWLSVACAVLAMLQATTVWGTWGRSDWTTKVVEFNMPEIPDPDHTMVLIGGYQPVGHLIPAFPPEIPFVRLQSNFVQPDSTDNGYSEVLRRRVMDHRGDYFMIATVPDTGIAADAAAFYGLRLDWDSCQVIHNNLGEPHSFCAVQRPPAEPR